MLTLRHMEQLLLLTSCDSPPGIEASLRTDGRTDERTDGWTHRRDVGNSILDLGNVIHHQKVCSVVYINDKRTIGQVVFIVWKFAAIEGERKSLF